MFHLQPRAVILESNASSRPWISAADPKILHPKLMSLGYIPVQELLLNLRSSSVKKARVYDVKRSVQASLTPLSTSPNFTATVHGELRFQDPRQAPAEAEPAAAFHAVSAATAECAGLQLHGLQFAWIAIAMLVVVSPLVKYVSWRSVSKFRW